MLVRIDDRHRRLVVCRRTWPEPGGDRQGGGLLEESAAWVCGVHRVASPKKPLPDENGYSMRTTLPLRGRGMVLIESLA